MKRRTLIPCIVLLTLLGFADACYLAYDALSHTALTCGIASLDGCNIVAQSAYSHFLGIPLGVYGVLFYGVFLVLVLRTFHHPSRRLDRSLIVLGFLGLAASAYFIYLQVAVIRALCVYCIASAGIAFLLAFATLAFEYPGRMIGEEAAPEPASPSGPAW